MLVVLIAVTELALATMALSMRILRGYERGILFRLGRLLPAHDPHLCS